MTDPLFLLSSYQSYTVPTFECWVGREMLRKHGSGREVVVKILLVVVAVIER